MFGYHTGLELTPWPCFPSGKILCGLYTAESEYRCLLKVKMRTRAKITLQRSSMSSFLIYYACFPLNLSWAKLFSFFFLVGDSSTWAIAAVSNSFPAHPCPTLDLWLGETALCLWCKQLCGDTDAKMQHPGRGRPVQCADSAAVKKEGWREGRSDAERDKNVSV